MEEVTSATERRASSCAKGEGERVSERRSRVKERQRAPSKIASRGCRGGASVGCEGGGASQRELARQGKERERV